MKIIYQFKNAFWQNNDYFLINQRRKILFLHMVTKKEFGEFTMQRRCILNNKKFLFYLITLYFLIKMSKFKIFYIWRALPLFGQILSSLLVEDFCIGSKSELGSEREFHFNLPSEETVCLFNNVCRLCNQEKTFFNLNKIPSFNVHLLK